MAAIVAGDLTLTVNNRDRVRVNQKSMVMAHVAYTTGALTYPATGVPLPAIGSFGMKKAIDFVNVMPTPSDGYMVKYDKTNHSLRLYQGALEGTHTHTITPTGSVAAPVLTGTPAVFSATGEQIESFSLQNMLGGAADVADSMTADQAVAPVNAGRIDTAAAVAAGAWTYTENNEIDFPRNVAIVITNDSGGPLSMEEGVFSATVTGFFRGVAQTDVITHTFGAGDKTIATANFRWKFGVKPFEKITDVVVAGLTANQNGLKLGVGLGRLIGVPANTANELVADFVKVVKAGANVVPTAYSTANKTLDLGAIADNDDFDIWYKTASVANYTPAGTNSAPAFTGAEGTTSASGSHVAGVFAELGGVAVPTLSVDLQVWGE